MTTKPETVIKQIEELPKIQRLPLLQFKDWLLEEEDSSMTNVGNYLRVLKLFSIELGNFQHLSSSYRIHIVDLRSFVRDNQT